MTTFTIRLAEVNIEVHSLFEDTKTFCKDYLVDAPAQTAQNSGDKNEPLTPSPRNYTPAFTVEVTPEDIVAEQAKSDREAQVEGIQPNIWPDTYLETLALYRKIVVKLLEQDIILFHGSVIAVDGQGYLFTAKSGTGKSTHTRLWRQQFGDRAQMINDDKPLLRIAPVAKTATTATTPVAKTATAATTPDAQQPTQYSITAYGTPWDGKHHLSTNTSVPLKAICILKRGEHNTIHPVDAREAYPMLVQQIYRPADPMAMMKTMQLIDRLTAGVGLYELSCNMDPEAAIVAYEGMQE